MEARPWANSDRVTYRYHPAGKRPISLGTDLAIAISRVLGMQGSAKALDALEPSLLRQTLERHRKGAKQRGIPFLLSPEDLADVLTQQGNKCAITKIQFNTLKPGGLRIRPWIPSIDRKNSKRGYERSNIRVVCAFANVAMNGFGEELFRLVLRPLIEEAVQERLQALENSRGNNTFRE